MRRLSDGKVNTEEFDKIYNKIFSDSKLYLNKWYSKKILKNRIFFIRKAIRERDNIYDNF